MARKLKQFALTGAKDLDDTVTGGWDSENFHNSGIYWDHTNQKWYATSGVKAAGGGGGGGTPGGANTQVQFNDGGSFGGDTSFTWDKNANSLAVAGTLSSQIISGGTIQTASLILNANTISGLTDPIWPSAAASKHYVDNNSGGGAAGTNLGYDFLIYFDGTDYVAKDGTSGGDDSTDASDVGVVIQYAADRLAVSGGTILIDNGEFDVTSRVFLSSNITLRGMGRGTILKAASGFDGTSSERGIINNAHYDDGHDVGITIRDLTLDGNSAVVVTDNEMGIHLHYVDNCLIDNVLAKDFKNLGIFVTRAGGASAYDSQSTNVKIVNCTALKNQWDGIAYTSDYGVIQNCYTSGNTKCGINLEESRFTQVLGCHAFYNAHYGVKIAEGTGLAGSGNIADSNICKYNGYGGIAFTRINGGIVTNNYCADNNLNSTGNHGIYATEAKNCLIAGNTCMSNDGDGIRLTGTSDSYGIVIQNNIVKGNGTNQIYTDIDNATSRVFNNYDYKDGYYPSLSSQSISGGSIIGRPMSHYLIRKEDSNYIGYNPIGQEIISNANFATTCQEVVNNLFYSGSSYLFIENCNEWIDIDTSITVSGNGSTQRDVTIDGDMNSFKYGSLGTGVEAFKFYSFGGRQMSATLKNCVISGDRDTKDQTFATFFNVRSYVDNITTNNNRDCYTAIKISGMNYLGEIKNCFIHGVTPIDVQGYIDDTTYEATIKIYNNNLGYSRSYNDTAGCAIRLKNGIGTQIFNNWFERTDYFISGSDTDHIRIHNNHFKGSLELKKAICLPDGVHQDISNNYFGLGTNDCDGIYWDEGWVAGNVTDNTVYVDTNISGATFLHMNTCDTFNVQSNLMFLGHYTSGCSLVISDGECRSGNISNNIIMAESPIVGIQPPIQLNEGNGIVCIGNNIVNYNKDIDLGTGSNIIIRNNLGTPDNTWDYISSQIISGGTIVNPSWSTLTGGGSADSLHTHTGLSSSPGGSLSAHIGSDYTFGASGLSFVSSQNISGNIISGGTFGVASGGAYSLMHGEIASQRNLDAELSISLTSDQSVDMTGASNGYINFYNDTAWQAYVRLSDGRLAIKGDLAMWLGGNIGTNSDTDLINVADDAVTINGSLGATQLRNLYLPADYVIVSSNGYHCIDGSGGKILSSDTTDASVPINYAISQLPASGGTVYINAGEYMVNNNITYMKGTHLIGAGKIATNLNCENATDRFMISCGVDGWVSRYPKFDSFSLRNAPVHGICIKDTYDPIISNVSFYDTVSSAIMLHGGDGTIGVGGTHIYDCAIDGGKIGIEFSSQKGGYGFVNTTYAHNLNLTNQSDYGIYMPGISGETGGKIAFNHNKFSDIQIQTCAGTGMCLATKSTEGTYYYTIDYPTIHNIYFDNCTKDIKIGHWARFVDFYGGSLHHDKIILSGNSRLVEGRPAKYTIVPSGVGGTNVQRFGDLYCDGINDEVEINYALDNLPYNGVVQLLEGTYYIKDKIVTDSNVTLQGVGYGTVIKSDTANMDMIFPQAVTNITIKDLRLDGNSNTSDIGVYFNLVNDSVIDNVMVTNTGEHGIFLSDSMRNRITNCRVENSTQQGISLYTNADQNIVSNCITRNNTMQGILVYQGDHNIISHNFSSGNSTDIDVESGENNKLTENIHYSWDYDIHQPADYIIYRTGDNYHAKRGSDGVMIKEEANNAQLVMQEVFNRLVEVSGGRVYIEAGTYPISSIAISSDCIIEGAVSPFRAVNTDDFKGTTLYATGKLKQNCIHISPNSVDHHVTITNLQQYGNPDSGFGIYASGVAQLEVDNCVIRCNGRGGLYATRCFVNNIRDCDFRNNYQEGIILSGQSKTKIDHCHIGANSGQANVYNYINCATNIVTTHFENYPYSPPYPHHIYNEGTLRLEKCQIGSTIASGGISTNGVGGVGIRMMKKANEESLLFANDTNFHAHMIAISGTGDIRVRGCSFTKMSSNTIWLAGSDRSNISNNYINMEWSAAGHQAAMDGIFLHGSVDNAVIAGNTIYSTVGNSQNNCRGIDVNGSYCTIANNNIRHLGDHGIFVVGDSHSILGNIIFSCNNNGIQLQETYDLTVKGNVVKKCLNKGIGCLAGYPNESIITDNVLSGNATNLQTSTGIGNLINNNIGGTHVYPFLSSQNISGGTITTNGLALQANTISGLIDPIWPSAAASKHYADNPDYVSSQAISGSWTTPIFDTLAFAGNAEDNKFRIVCTSGNANGTWVWISITPDGTNWNWVQMAYNS